MKTGSGIRRTFWWLLLAMLSCSAMAYEDYPEYVAAVASNENAWLQANYLIDDLDTLESFYITDHQQLWMTGPVLPGTDVWMQSASPYDIPFDWSVLPSLFTSGLIATTDLGVVVYPMMIRENPTNHLIEYLADTNVIYTMTTAYTNTSRYATNAYPGLYEGGYTTDEVAYIEAMYAPSRFVLSLELIEDTNLYTFLYNEIFLLGEPNSTSQEILEDADGDGVSNRDELQWGTDPYDPGEKPGVTGMELTNGNIVISWPAPSNRNYLVEQTDNMLGDSWSAVTGWQGGINTNRTYSDSGAVTSRFFRYQIDEEDLNANGLPDWWEVQYWGGLTTNLPSGDNDGDGLDNAEELYFGYSPLVSERELIHSIYHSVVVNSNTPTIDDGTERFDFHGGGRPLSLASGASDGFGKIYAEIFVITNQGTGEGKYVASHSGGIFFNNDEDNLYVGVSGLNRDGNNAFIIFIDSDGSGVTNLEHLTGQPYALGKAMNFRFNETSFTPNVAIILGDCEVDGQNDADFSIGDNEVGLGVYQLSSSATISDFPGFSRTSGGAPFSQWRMSGDTNQTPRGGCETALSLAALNAIPGDTIKVAALFVGGTDGSNRWASTEVYGQSVNMTPSSGFDPVTIVGSTVHLASAAQSLPNPGYAGFTEDDVLLQGFYWDVKPEWEWWNIMAGQASNISAAGFTMVWFPPPYKGANVNYSVGYDPFDHYDLGEYAQKSSYAQTLYGTKSQFLSALSAVTSWNVTAICDIVPNHMAGGSGVGYTTFDYPHNTFEKSATDFHPSSAGYNDEMFPYHSNGQFGDPGDHPLDVAFLSPNMRLGMKQWGSWLANTIGFRGWRIDFSEGIEPWAVWEWCHYPAQRPYFAFMEYWEVADGREMQEWLDLTGRKAAIYDSNLRSLLKRMSEDGDNFDMRDLTAPSLLGLEPEYTIVYIDNHDSSRENDGEKMGILEDKPLAYAYAFHSQGLPMVFWRDYFDGAYINSSSQLMWGTEIKGEINRLIKIRNAAVGGDSTVLHADSDMYVQERSGDDAKFMSMLVLNDSSASRTNTIQTSWFNTQLFDLVSTSGAPHSVTTDITGAVAILMPPESYRIYATTNALNEVNAP